MSNSGDMGFMICTCGNGLERCWSFRVLKRRCVLRHVPGICMGGFMLQKASVARCLGLKVGSKVEVCGVGVLARHTGSYEQAECGFGCEPPHGEFRAPEKPSFRCRAGSLEISCLMTFGLRFWLRKHILRGAQHQGSRSVKVCHLVCIASFLFCQW